MKVKPASAKFSQHLTAWRRLRELRALTLDRCSIEELVERVGEFANDFFGTEQIRPEIVEALRIVRELRPRYIIEIGTAGGGTLLMWSRVAHPKATIVSIDLPGGDFGGGSSWLRTPFFRRMMLPDQTLHIIRGNSHEPATFAKASALLDGSPLDFLFIDGDHTEAGVRADFDMYGSLVRPGGLTALHDIAVRLPKFGVWRFWEELSGTGQVHAILGGTRPYGIGLVYR